MLRIVTANWHTKHARRGQMEEDFSSFLALVAQFCVTSISTFVGDLPSALLQAEQLLSSVPGEARKVLNFHLHLSHFSCTFST